MIYLSALLVLALTQFIRPVFPTDIIDQLLILIPIAVYSPLVIFSWHRTVP